MPVDEPLNLAACPRCQTPVYRWKVGGIEYTADLTALTAAGAIGVKIAGRRLYRITLVGPTRNIRPAYTTELAALSSAEPPTIVGGHPCNAVTRPLGTPQPAGGPGAPGKAPSPSAGRQTPFSGPSTEPSGVPAAATRSTDRPNPRCDACGKPCGDGTYAAIEVGDLVVWAQHVTGECAENGQNGA